MSEVVGKLKGEESSGAGLAPFLVPGMLIGAVMMMVIPVPAPLLDLFLAANITLGVLTLLTVMLLSDPLALSVFPSLILMTTLLRLALNVSSTRLILLDGYAGKVIETFGDFVVGGSVVVGLVVFLILVVIQFVVITNGAGRVAEVAARFTLDAMPGKQMAIDADLSAGLIDEAEARHRRERIAEEADFHGAMDGASKFVKGDAIAGIIIVLINLIGGFAIGVGSRGLSLTEAISTYSLLTIGDGLVSQIPALLLSISTGLLVTRVGKARSLGSVIHRQLFSDPKALRAGAVVIALMAMLPGLPKLPFGLLAVGMFIAAGRTVDHDAADEEARTVEATVETSADDPEALVERMRVEPLELHLSYDILDLIDTARGGDLLERVRSLRQQIALDVGIVMPYVRTRDDVTLPPSTYRILLHGVEVARGSAPQDKAMALPVGDGSELAALNGTATTEPVFGLTAYWIDATARSAAAATGATVVDRSSVVVTHLAEVVRSNASDLLSRQQVQLLVDGLRYDEPLLANEVGSETLPLGLLHNVLRRLLDDRVGVRDLPRIIDAVSGAGGLSTPIDGLVDAARIALGPSIVAKVAPEGVLAVLTFEPIVEAGLHEVLREVDGTVHLVIDPTRSESLRRDVERALTEAARQPHPSAIVCGQALRRPLHRLLTGVGLQVAVLGYPELPANLDLIPTGVIGRATVDA